MKSMKYAFVIPYIAIFTGWIVTEVGRQPWVVYGLMKTSEGVSNVPTSQVWFSLITSTLMYFAILFMIIYFFRHQSRKSLGVTKYLYKVKGGVDVE